ncbi:ABC transporter permease [Sphingomonas sp. DBB INV C78]|uniref:ABC transporter permease/substrate-binding protein n=1 Tax=Sphingomonas sp. DBB INV C78 TaxID=3349434 RepID=UPI0036D20EC5
MNPAFAAALADLPQLAAQHLLLSGCALLVAVVLGSAVALWLVRRPSARAPVLGAIALAQTIPAIALLALFYPALVLAGQVTTLPIPALGFLPAFLALSLYALLPIVRNGVAALESIDPAVIEAADAMGMTGRQRLMRVELPLGAPIWLAGIRTAAVWTIGTATLATTVGQSSLGNLIFSGLQTEDWPRVLVGCCAAALLALLVDGLLALIETGVARRSPGRLLAGGALIATLLAAAGLVAFAPNARAAPIIIGAKNFSEQYILAALIEDRLTAAGYRVERRDNLGSAIAYRALAAGDVDVYVDYSGTLWANVLQRRDTPPPGRMLEELGTALKQRDNVRLLGPLGFENAYALAMKRSRAQALNIRSLDDLAAAAPKLRLASDLEFLNRPEWRALAAAYGLRFADQRAYSPTFMYRAIGDGSADLISAFTSDGRIAALDLVTLADPRHALPNYDAILLLSPRRASDRRFVDVLQPLVRAIPIDRMRQANLMVDRTQDKRTPAEAARWLLPRAP